MIQPRFLPGPRFFAVESQPVRAPLGVKRYVLAVTLLALTNLACGLSENFHAVVDDKVYRSGQLGSDSLESHINREGVRSIINLRGANPGREWYQQECTVAIRNGVQHFDVPIDSDSPPAGRELLELVRVLKTCPKPVLLHCQSGIDRSGVAAAICVLLLDEQGTMAKALDQLSLRFGHLPWRANWGRQCAFLRQYESWLMTRGLAHSCQSFQSWLGQRATEPAFSGW